MTTDLRSHMAALGDGAVITYIGQEGDRWHCDINLPRLHYTVSLTTADGSTPDEAVENAVHRARTMFAKAQEGSRAA